MSLEASFGAVDKWLATLPQKAAKGAEVGLKELGLKIFTESQQIVPVDTGLLKSTGRLEFKGSGFSTVVVISYGVRYAIYVHEQVEVGHKPGQMAKFVEIPMRKYRPKATKIIGKQVNTFIRTSGPSYTTFQNE